MARLTRLLMQVNEDAPKAEAKKLAEDIIQESAKLEKKFGRRSNPYWHNFLVNAGLKQKGLCYHYSDALYQYFARQHYPHFEFHLLGAHIGEYWQEHNALGVSATGKPLFGGIVVDPWRHTDAVYVSKIVEDKAYRWRHRPERGCR